MLQMQNNFHLRDGIIYCGINIMACATDINLAFLCLCLVFGELSNQETDRVSGSLFCES